MNKYLDLLQTSIRSLWSEISFLRSECSSNRELSNLLLGIILEKVGSFEEQSFEAPHNTAFAYTHLCPSRLP